jgi:hypothetical protein
MYSVSQALSELPQDERLNFEHQRDQKKQVGDRFEVVADSHDCMIAKSRGEIPPFQKAAHTRGPRRYV